MEIKITINELTFIGRLTNTPNAKLINDSLPITSKINTWGDEIYFSTAVKGDLESDAKTILEVGDLAFYPPLNAICIFFGPTPLSRGSQPEAAGPVNLLGRLIDPDISKLRSFSDGMQVVVEKNK